MNVYPEIRDKIQFELSPKPSKQQKAAQGKSGFVPVKVRWVVERSNAWVERCKSLVKNFERNLFNANQKLKLCFVRLLVKKFATFYPLQYHQNLSNNLLFVRCQTGSIHST